MASTVVDRRLRRLLGDNLVFWWLVITVLGVAWAISFVLFLYWLATNG